MPSSISTKHNGVKCTFEEAAHRYYHGECASETDRYMGEMISVSTLVHQFAPPFDQSKCAERVAIREGEDVMEVLKRWEEKRDMACYYGTRTHETAEDCLLGRSPRNKPENEAERMRFKAVWNYAKDHLYGAFKRIEVEKLVFSPRLGVAGTIDFLGMKDAKWFVLDWKTNENLKKPAYENYLEPFGHIPNDSIHTYALQLSMYRLLLQCEGYVSGGFGDAFALWVRPETPDGTDYAVEPVKLPDLRTEAAMMIALKADTKWYREYMARSPF